MKIVVFDKKEQRNKFLRGKLGNCFWVDKEEDAFEYTKDDYEKILKDFRNKKMNPNYSSLGFK